MNRRVLQRRATLIHLGFSSSIVPIVGFEMSFKVIHHEGDKDLLVERVKVIADQRKTSQKITKFVRGRSFFTGNSGFGFGFEINCGYLISDEVREFLGLLKPYASGSTIEGEKEFVECILKSIFYYRNFSLICYSIFTAMGFLSFKQNSFNRLI